MWFLWTSSVDQNECISSLGDPISATPLGSCASDPGRSPGASAVRLGQVWRLARRFLNQQPCLRSRPARTSREVGRAVVQVQLERILANPLFKNSKQYPNLLHYVLVRTLDGYPGELEVDAFRRPPAVTFYPTQATELGSLRSFMSYGR
jgi:hypothetical protein